MWPTRTPTPDGDSDDCLQNLANRPKRGDHDMDAEGVAKNSRDDGAREPNTGELEPKRALDVSSRFERDTEDLRLALEGLDLERPESELSRLNWDTDYFRRALQLDDE